MTTRLMGLAVLLLVALLPVAQGVAATSFEAEPMAEACVMLPDTQVMHDCAGLNAEGSCSSPCSTSHVGKSAIRDSVVLLSSPLPERLFFSFRPCTFWPRPFSSQVFNSLLNL